MLLNNEWFNYEIKEEIKTFLETNENEHTTAQNLWDTAKAVLKGKLIILQAHVKKRTISKKQRICTCTRPGVTTTNKTQSK